MKLDRKLELRFLLLFLFSNGVRFLEGNLTNSQQINDIQNQVYFHPLTDLFIEEFALGSHGQSERDFNPKIQPPLIRISHRPLNREAFKATGTLPLAKKSHVVNNSVTESPGPSYLTDSSYYHETARIHTTPAPRSGRERSNHRVSDERKIEGFHEEAQRTFLPEMHEKSKRITLLLPKNPAYFYYIPTSSENISPESSQPKPSDSLVDTHTTIIQQNNPNSTTIFSSFHAAKTSHRSVSNISQLPSSTPTNLNSKPHIAVSTHGSHNLSEVSSGKHTSVPLSETYLPKPAPNPFAPRFSKQTMKSETPSFASSLSDRTSTTIFRETTTITSLFLNDTHLENRTQLPKEENLLSSSSGDKEETYNHFLRHFGIHSNNAAVNTIKQKRKTDLMKDVKKKEQKNSIRTATTDFFSVPSLFRD